MQAKPDESLRQIFNDFCQTTTFLYVIPKLVSPMRLIFRLVYTAAIIVSVYYFCRNAWDKTSAYFQYDVDTLVERVNEADAVEFPTVTICNMQVCGFSGYSFEAYLAVYKTEETKKFGESKDAEIDNKFRTNKTKSNYFLAREIFLRQHLDADLTKILNNDKPNISDQGYKKDFLKLIRYFNKNTSINI